ncbi:hypothetical protein CROQUDRAFT_496719 [Cronartium quercuum f. sp. fusiforme G11]|uniref:Uncharacterized protein n=1 Tax=Cronartium quercuum f. sp. fusiforme G11 TaxID=708437 RepID=A0A9P6TCJ6_9BASI|nr:hypothetical protein CROQUDRAFT_496719 [Cronartium quercuum f. sp. fusiforme G11]
MNWTDWKRDKQDFYSNLRSRSNVSRKDPHRIKPEPDPTCVHCSAIETPAHFLKHCKHDTPNNDKNSMPYISLLLFSFHVYIFVFFSQETYCKGFVYIYILTCDFVLHNTPHVID